MNSLKSIFEKIIALRDKATTEESWIGIISESVVEELYHCFGHKAHSYVNSVIQYVALAYDPNSIYIDLHRDRIEIKKSIVEKLKIKFNVRVDLGNDNSIYLTENDMI